MAEGPGFYVYTDVAGEWRWTLKAANGRTIADGSEGYRTRQGCLEAVERVQDAAPGAHLHFEQPR